MGGPHAKKKKVQTEFICDTCGKLYKTKKYFERHVLSHTSADPTKDLPDPKQPEISQPNSCRVLLPTDNLSDYDECQLPPDYEWDEWCEDDENEEPSYFELEDEEEEARRDPESLVAKADSTKQQKKKPFLIKCQDCTSKFNLLDTYVRHRAGHGMKAAYMNAPTMEKISEVAPELCKPILDAMENSVLTGGHASFIASTACRLKEKLNSEAMLIFFKSLCEGLCFEFLSNNKDFLSPSQLAVTFLQNTSAFISSVSERETLHQLLCDVLGSIEERSSLNMFIAYFMRKFCDKILVFILRSLRLVDGTASVSSIRERYAKSSQSTDSTDFIQNMHYIGGSNIRSVIRTAMKYKTAEWKRVLITLRKLFLVSDFASAPAHELSAWTEVRDRGGLLKISKNALDFFVFLGKEVKPLERLDGSLLNEEVFDAVAQCAPLLCLWDELKGDLSGAESFKLLHALVSHFCYTWRNGIVGRRHDEMALSKSEKHGTGGVAFRARLGGELKAKKYCIVQMCF